MSVNFTKAISFLNNVEGSLKDKTIRSGLWVTFGSVIVRIIVFLRSIILARLLTPEIFGLMAIILMISSGLEAFTQTGFGAAIVQRKKNYSRATDTAWVITILRGFFLAGLLFLISPLVSDFYHRPELDLFFKVMCVGFIIEGFNNINVVLLQKELDFKYITLSQQTVMIINFVVVVSVAYYFRSAWALVVGQLTMSLCGSVFSYFIQPIRPQFKFDKEIAKELFSYGKFLTGGGIIVFMTLQIDNAVIGKVLGMEALGYYALAYSLASLPATHFTSIISRVMFPAYSKLQDDKQRLNSVYLKTIRLVASLTIPAAFGIALLGPEIIAVVYGEKWLPAVPALRVLCILGLMRSIGATTGPLFNAINKPHIPFYLNSIKLIVIAIIIYPLTLKYNTLGTASAIILPSFFMQIVLWTIMRKINHISLIKIMKPIFSSLVASILMVAAIEIFTRIQDIQNAITLLFLQIFLGVLVYSLIQISLDKSFLKKTIFWIKK